MKDHQKQVIQRALIAASWLLQLSTTLPAFAEKPSAYQEEIDRVSKQISQISKRLNSDRSLLRSERTTLMAQEQAILVLRQRLITTHEDLQKQRTLQQDLERKVALLEEGNAANKAALAELLRQRYLKGNTDYVKMILNQENPYAVGRLQNYYHYFTKAHNSEIQQRITALQQLVDLRKQQSAEIVRLSELQKLQNRQQTELEQAQSQREQRIAKIASTVSDQQIRLKALQQDRTRLTSLLEQIAEQAKKLKALQAAENRKARSDRPTRQPVAGGFEQQRGRLNAPVAGKLKYTFGSRIAESGMRAEGIFFDTGRAAPVRVIFRGRVLFADFLKGYGLLLIIDHGDDHISLYGHNQLLYKKVGDMVDSNEIVALTGVTGGLKSAGLYFEIRHNTTPVNPGEWCQI